MNRFPRWFVRNLESALNVLPVTVVTSARQTGKITLVKSLGPSVAYFTLDDSQSIWSAPSAD